MRALAPATRSHSFFQFEKGVVTTLRYLLPYGPRHLIGGDWMDGHPTGVTLQGKSTLSRAWKKIRSGCWWPAIIYARVSQDLSFTGCNSVRGNVESNPNLLPRNSKPEALPPVLPRELHHHLRVTSEPFNSKIWSLDPGP